MTVLDLSLIAPWSDDTPDLLTRTLSHIARAKVVMANGEEFALDLEDGGVSYDETRSPRVQSSLTCRFPNDQALLDRLDPRAAARLVIDAGYLRPDGTEDVQPLVNLCLRSRTIQRPDDTMALAGLSDESLVIDNAPSNGGTINSTNTAEAIKYVIRLVFPGVTVTTSTGGAFGPAVNQNPIGDKWDAIADLSDRIETQTFDDGLRNWMVRSAPVLATPALALAVGTNGTVIESQTGLDRDDGFYNRVFVTYKWTDNSDVDRKVVTTRSVTTGPYAAVTGNIRTLELNREIPTTQAQADAAATAMVKRTVTRGRSFVIRAVAAYWLRPGHTVEVTLPLGDPEQHLVSAVDFDLRAGTMRVTTRLPDGNYTIGA